MMGFVEPPTDQAQFTSRHLGLQDGESVILGGWEDPPESVVEKGEFLAPRRAEHIRKLPWFHEHLSSFYTPAEDSEEPATIHDEIYEIISPSDSLKDAIRKARRMKAKSPAVRRVRKP